MSELEGIAESYHLAAVPDQWIENACQVVELSWLSSFLSDSNTVIDLGYGDGLISPRVAGQVGKYILLEGSERLVSEAQTSLSAFPRAIIYEAMFDSWAPARGETADVILASHVLEHVEDPVSLLQTMSGWLNPDGIIIGFVPNALSVHRLVGVYAGVSTDPYELSERDHLVGHRRVYDLDSLTADVNLAGMKVVECRGFFLKPIDNRQLLRLNERAVEGLMTLGHLVGPRHAANIGFVLSC